MEFTSSQMESSQMGLVELNQASGKVIRNRVSKMEFPEGVKSDGFKSDGLKF
jgi:hypothetical protein